MGDKIVIPIVYKLELVRVDNPTIDLKASAGRPHSAVINVVSVDGNEAFYRYSDEEGRNNLPYETKLKVDNLIHEVLGDGLGEEGQRKPFPKKIKLEVITEVNN